MKTYHLAIEQEEDGWLAAHAVEDERVHTQGRTLAEVAANIREVAELLRGEREVQVERSVPSSVVLMAAHA
jgi:predicted RNase H-like HicB family nuclease